MSTVQSHSHSLPLPNHFPLSASIRTSNLHFFSLTFFSSPQPHPPLPATNSNPVALTQTHLRAKFMRAVSAL